MTPTLVEPASPDYPPTLLREGSGMLPAPVCGIGNLALLHQPLTALFCSVRCPGGLILQAFDRAAQLRDAGRAVISGFHTPVEKECLGILLRGHSPVVICPARGLETLRVPSAWKRSLADGRLLVLSCFPHGPARATADAARRRNEFVAALASEILVVHATPGGNLESLIQSPTLRRRTVRLSS